jgi:hypothetical protein
MDGVTWVHSYVNPDRTKTFCIYDGPSPEAIRTVAERNKLPVDRITEWVVRFSIRTSIAPEPGNFHQGRGSAASCLRALS